MTSLEQALIVVVVILSIFFFWYNHRVTILENQVEILKSEIEYWYDKYDRH